MAIKCKWCRSHDTQAALNTWQCLRCGRHTPMTEVPLPSPGLEATPPE